MTIHVPTAGKNTLLDKRALQQTFDDLNQQMGFTRDPSATAAQARTLILADGIRPEDCAFSREIIKMRSGDEE